MWLIIITHNIHFQATNERHEAELHRKEDEIIQKNVSVVQMSVKRGSPVLQTNPLIYIADYHFINNTAVLAWVGDLE